MRTWKRSWFVVLAARPWGVAWTVASRNLRDASGVAPGAKILLGVFCGMLGEKVDAAGGLLLIADARKMLRATPRELLLRVPLRASSRGSKLPVVADDAALGVPSRFAEPPMKGEPERPRFAKGSSGRDLGVRVLASLASSPGNANVTISEGGRSRYTKDDG